MKVKLEYEFDSSEAAEAFLQQVNALKVAKQDEEPVPAAKPAPRKAKAAKAEPVTPPTVRDEDLQVALDKVYQKFGMQGALDVLSRFGVKRLRDLPAEKRAQFITDAEDALKRDPA